MHLYKPNNHPLKANLVTTNTSNNNTNANKTFKKIVLLVFFVLFGVLLTGCANVTYSRVLHPNGAVEDKVIIFLQEDKLNAANVSVENLKANLEEDLTNIYFASIKAYKTHLLNIATPESLLEANQIVFGIEPESPNDQIVATIHFKTRSAFHNYTRFLEQLNTPPTNEEPGEEPTETETEDIGVNITKSFFYTVQTQTTNTVFTEKLFSDLGQKVLEYNFKYSKGELGFSDIKFSQIYGNSDKRLKSNADYSTTINNVKLHEWVITHPLSDNKPMQFYTFVPNTYNWYLTALALSMAVAIVVLTVGMLKNKNKNVIAKKDLM